jgi:hypothetical protein
MCNGKHEMQVEMASGIIADGCGHVKITQAMRLVGFTSPEIKNMKLYQQVRRQSVKVVVVENNKNITVVDSTVSNVLSLTNEVESQVIDITSLPDTTIGGIGIGVASLPSFGIGDGASGAASKVARATSKEVQRKHAFKATTYDN